LKPVEIRAAANERRPPSEAFGCDKIFWEMSKRVLFARLRCGANTMFTAYITVTGLTVAANIFAAVVDFLRCQWVLDNMTSWGGRHSWRFSLGALKAAGALGLLVGISVPPIGVAAAVGLVLFFVGAITVVIRARWSHTFRGRRRISCWPLDL
jgi:hypothetical protein